MSEYSVSFTSDELDMLANAIDNYIDTLADAEKKYIAVKGDTSMTDAKKLSNKIYEHLHKAMNIEGGLS